MAYKFCVVQNQSGYLPQSQEYYNCNSIAGVKAILEFEQRNFHEEYPEARIYRDYQHALAACENVKSTSNLNWLLAFDMGTDTVLEVIGMADDDWRREFDC